MPDHPLKTGGRFFQYRNGIDQFFWKGMATRTDLGAQPADHPRLVKNGRYFGGHIIARPPIQIDVAAVPERDGYQISDKWWIPSFATEHHSYMGVRVWWGATTTMAATAEITGGRVGFFDNDWDLDWKDLSNFHHAFDFAPRVERFANFIYVGDYEALRRLYRVDPIIKSSSPAAEYDKTVPAGEIVSAFPGYLVTALHLHEGKLYFALSDPEGVSNGYIYSWDGFQTVLEYSLGVSGMSGVSMASFGEQLVVVVRDYASIIYKNAAGVWATATVAGFDGSPYSNSMAAVKDKLYIVDGATKIFSWTGSALALAHEITTGTPDNTNVCAAWNGRLYYGWADWKFTGGAKGGTRAPMLGVFDPDTADASYKWNDSYVTWPNTKWGAPTAICSYRQRLVMSIGLETTVGGGYTLKTTTYSHVVPNNPHSQWHSIHSIQGGMPFIVSNGDPSTIEYMKVM